MSFQREAPREADSSRQDEPLVIAPQPDGESAGDGAREAAQKFRANVILGIMVASMILAAALAVVLSSKEKDIDFDDFSEASDFILNAEKMGEVAGFVPAPLYVITAKGYFNFAIQMLLYVGCYRILQGWSAIVQRLDQDVRFSSVSLAFQALGLTSTAFAYTSLALAIHPFCSWLHWQMFVYAVSVHSSTITLMVGLFNNGIIYESIVDDPTAAYSEKRVTQGFVLVGFTLALPIWAGMVSSWIGTLLWILPGTVVAGIIFRAFGGASWNSLLDAPFSHLAFVPLVVNFTIPLTWLCCQITSVDTWHLIGAVVLELYVPLVCLVVWAAWVHNGPWPFNAAYPVMVKGFLLGLSFAFIISMCLPASLVASDPSGSIGSAPPSVFLEKKGAAFLKYTFVVPMREAHDAMEALNSTDVYAQQTQIAFAQALSLFT